MGQMVCAQAHGVHTQQYPGLNPFNLKQLKSFNSCLKVNCLCNWIWCQIIFDAVEVKVSSPLPLFVSLRSHSSALFLRRYSCLSIELLCELQLCNSCRPSTGFSIFISKQLDWCRLSIGFVRLRQTNVH